MGARITVGERHGSLVVLGTSEITHPYGRSIRNLDIQCDCGRTVIMTNNIFRQRISCPHCSHERGAKKRVTHGDSKRGAQSLLYGAWKQMVNRCENPNSDVYRWYGGKGVTVCDEWRDYETFRIWAMANGYAPGMSLDRENADLGYCPDNCSYITRSENSIRMRKDYQVVKRSLIFSDHFPIEALFGSA